MVKLLENTFRSVNIGLVNELALMCYQLGINTWEVIVCTGRKSTSLSRGYSTWLCHTKTMGC